jgi:glycosyltransferase involved in cell wall biosynthesis
MADTLGGGKINSPDYWNKRFLDDWIANGGRQQTTFFARLCCRELPDWFVEEVRARKSTIFDYGCAVGDALPVLQASFPASPIRGGDVAQVGLGLARALHPAFEFVDVNAIGEGTKIADIVYCSNTLEHFENWRELLDRLSRHAKEYVIVVAPFEEEDRIDEHAATFEFDSLPPRLSSGARLLHLGVCDAGVEPETQWNGLQLIAIYGKKRRAGDPGSTGPISQPRNASLILDLRGVEPPAIPPLLAGLAAMSHGKRRIAREAQAQAATGAAALEVLGEYAELTRGVEAAQRWLLDELTALDPELIRGRQILPVPESWPADRPDDVAAHRAALARLIDAVHRANRVGLAFHARASEWHGERGKLTRQLQQARCAMERAVAERDRVRGRVPALAEIAEADRIRPEAAAAATGQAPPLVSIVLPVFNQGYLVDEAIAGVLSQTYRNWELIVLDDGSTDDLERRVRHYLADRRVLFLRQPNQKLPAALNHAFAYARGELLTWTSADNIMLPFQLERLVDELAAHPEAGLAYSDYWAIDDKGEPLDEPDWRSHNRDPEIPNLIRLPSEVGIENFHRSGDNFIGASFLYRRSVADIVGRYADDTFGGEDYDFWLRMHLVTAFRHVAEPLYRYRVHRDTLSSHAEELGLFANIAELLEADLWRIDTLLCDGALRTGPGDGALHTGESCLRPVGQFHPALLKRCRPVAYRSLAERDRAATPPGPAVVDPDVIDPDAIDSGIADPVIVDIDVPVRTIDAAMLRHADILLCRSELTAALLRREAWALDKRILMWNGEPTQALQHAFIQAFADRVSAPAMPPKRRALPRIDDPFRPARVLLLVDRWASGGLENIVIDLADSLAGNGRSVFVASAGETPPPANAFASPQIGTLSFRGDESLFEAFLREEAVEVVNYHHSCFAAARAKEQAVATVYTMHNCYLWMDDAARQRVGVGLLQMDRVIAVSRQVAQFAVAQFDFPGDRIDVVANGLSDDIMCRATAPSGRRVGGSDTPFTVAMAASLTRPKLQHVAIAAFAEVAPDIPQLHLRLIGVPLDQAYHHELEARIAASPQQNRIELIAGLTRAETIAALAKAEVFLLPSLVEGCSMALLEAAAAGCVCIASDVGGARDLDIAGGSVVLIASPLGELDRVTQRQFLDAASADLPEHRSRIAEALRTVWRDYGAFAGGIAQTRARLRELSGMQQMTDAYLRAYTLASRGGHAAAALSTRAIDRLPREVLNRSE